MNQALHIAVLDDEVDITQLLAEYLRGQGYRVTPVHDGRSLMALMPLDRPALVLLDLGLQTPVREAGPFDRTIDVQVGRLRKKLEPGTQEPQLIKSARGAGLHSGAVGRHGLNG